MGKTDWQKKIDGMTYKEMLYALRYNAVGDSLFQGESGDYIMDRMSAMRALPGGNEEHTKCSKDIGWDR